MNVKLKIEEREKDLLNFIYEKIGSNVSMYCQSILHQEAVHAIANKERELIQKSLMPELTINLKKIAPLHSYVSRVNFLDSFYNDCCCYIYDCDWKARGETEKKLIHLWPTITFGKFEEEGFSTDFTKRVIKKYQEIGEITQIRGIGGYIYQSRNLEDICKDLKPECKGVRNGYTLDYCHDLDWIYKDLNKDWLDERFLELKTWVINLMKQSTETKGK